MLRSCSATVAGSAMSPYSEMAAIRAGKTARKATPPASMGTLSADASLNARRTTWNQPVGGSARVFRPARPGSAGCP